MVTPSDHELLVCLRYNLDEELKTANFFLERVLYSKLNNAIAELADLRILEASITKCKMLLEQKAEIEKREKTTKELEQ